MASMYIGLVSLNNDLAPKIKQSLEEYMELVIPGLGKAQKENEEQGLQKQMQLLDQLDRATIEENTQRFLKNTQQQQRTILAPDSWIK